MRLVIAIIISSFFTLFLLNKLIQTPHSTPDEHEGSAQYTYYRLRNPLTNKIPRDIRKRELEFAQTLPQNSERSISWEAKGPNNQGGRTRALAMDITNENILLAGAVSGGIWRSTNGGQQWTKCTQPGQLHSTTCIAQDIRTGKTNTWYCGTGEQYGIVNGSSFSSRFSGNGIFKSTNGGITWSLLSSTQSNTPTTTEQKKDMDFVWEIVCDPVNDSDVVYAATVNGIWRSTNGGASWLPVLGLDTIQNGISTYTDIAITQTGILYATISTNTSSKGIWRSEDGVSWTKISPVGFSGSAERIEIGISPSNENIVFFIAETPGSGITGHQLWRYEYLSGDGTSTGGTWINRTANIPADPCTGFFNFDFAKFNSQSSYDLYVAVHPQNPDVVYLGGTNIYRSDNGFSTPDYSWIGGYQCDTGNLYNYIYPNHHPDQHKLIFSPSNPNIAYSATDGGIYRTSNIRAGIVEWTNLNTNYSTGQFYTCALENTIGNQLIVGGLQDNGTFWTNTTNPNESWKQVARGDGSYCHIPLGHPFYILSWQTGKTYKVAIDNNGTTTNICRIDPTGASGQLFINPFITNPGNDSVLYYAGGRFIYRNDDIFSIPLVLNVQNTTAQNWIKLNGSNVGGGINSSRISALAMAKSQPNILFYGTDNGKVYRLDSCKTNNNTSKTDITGANFPVGAYVSCIDVDDNNHNRISITFSNYEVISIFHTEDGGQSWIAVAGNLEENADGSGSGPSVNWIHKTKINGQTIWLCATSTGLYSTDQLNGPATLWVQEGATTIGNVVINMITSRPDDETILIATHGNGLYSNKTYNPSTVSEKSRESGLCYPNPASKRLYVKNETPLQLRLYNNQGKLMINLNLEENKESPINISDWPEGVYIARFSGKSYEWTEKIIIRH